MPPAGEERRHGRRLARATAQHATPGARAGGSTAGTGAGASAATPPPGRSLSAQFAALGQGGPRGWDCLPHTALAAIFNRLELRDLAAAASVCGTWRYEASLDARWRAFWQRQVSDTGLWRWAKADGGYRQQLRAKHLMRRGDCVASVFPFNRRDGPVSEVLFFDGGPTDAHKRVLTVQAPKVPGQSVRLHGSCLKVWDAAGLASQRPLLVLHDVLKHMQLEDGRLFLWRIAGDAVVPVDCSNPEDPQQVAEAAHWTEHPAIVSSVLEPGPLTVRDVPLEAPYGRRVTPCEWLDMSGGLVAGSLMVPSAGRVDMRVFDLATGACVRASSCALPPNDHAAQQLLHDHEVTMIVTRSAEAGSLVAATCALFDWRVFMWRMRDEGPPAGGGAPLAPAGERAAAWDAPAGGAVGGGGPHELRHVFSTADEEPIVDVSISTASHRLFVVGMENIFVADLAGVPLMRVSLARWRGVTPPGQPMAPSDVGAFSWPLPNSPKTAFFLDATNSLFVAEFRRPQVSDVWYMRYGDEREHGRDPHFDHHVAQCLLPGQPDVPYFVQSHTDLRPPPTAHLASTVHGRAAGLHSSEPGIVEYTHDGGVLLTSADAGCPAVAALLAAEKAAGSYLAGLGPRSAAARGRAAPALVRGGPGQRGQLAPRALVLLDAASGRRFKVLPLEGVCESVHSAGHWVVLSVAELGAYPDGLNGSIVVLDFAGRGLGAGGEPPAASPQPEAPGGEAAARGGRRRGGARRAGKEEAGEEEEEAEEPPRRQRGKAKPKVKPRQKQQRGRRKSASAAAADDEAGPSRKRGKR